VKACAPFHITALTILAFKRLLGLQHVKDLDLSLAELGPVSWKRKALSWGSAAGADSPGSL